MRTYTELMNFQTFEERFRYLMLNGRVGDDTFGFDRWINQMLYHSTDWVRSKRDVIIRDNGCDLGIPGREIHGKIFVHHMNPITKEDILNRSSIVLNPEYLICVSKATHDAIHFGDDRYLNQNKFAVRFPNDTCPWRNTS